MAANLEPGAAARRSAPSRRLHERVQSAPALEPMDLIQIECVIHGEGVRRAVRALALKGQRLAGREIFQSQDGDPAVNQFSQSVSQRIVKIVAMRSHRLPVLPGNQSKKS